ncbi:MAG: DUF1566 domain-containing protein, partial [Candidatus Wallbacteria bacterium]|nr:DUF1566 domain-containing protein [Candidatus Wallbacteria bacterium]
WDDGWCMVRDNNSGLVWEVKSPVPDDLNYFEDRYTWQESCDAYITALNDSEYGGFTDWRLPNREELRSIADYSGIIPAVDRAYFPGCLPEFYWSGDSYRDKDFAWGIYFAYGCAICYLKEIRYCVMAVRGGHNPSFGDMKKYSFQDNNNGTVTDLNTGLMWKKDESPELDTIETLKYCAELDLAGHKDWRLPSIKEIATLIDLNFPGSAWFDKRFFPDVKTKPLGFYSASTTYGSSFGWGVNFQFGYDGYYASKKTGKYCFRPVRRVK